jgi:uncharacterized membrane protein YsdA (DUF1294 family)
MSKQLNKKEEDRNIVIKVNPKIMVPLVGFSLCALVGGWFGWGLATFFYQLTNVSGSFWNLSFPAAPWPFPTATMVVCALIGGRVGYVVCWRWVKGIMSDFSFFFYVWLLIVGLVGCVALSI